MIVSWICRRNQVVIVKYQDHSRATFQAAFVFLIECFVFSKFVLEGGLDFSPSLCASGIEGLQFLSLC